MRRRDFLLSLAGAVAAMALPACLPVPAPKGGLEAMVDATDFAPLYNLGVSRPDLSAAIINLDFEAKPIFPEPTFEQLRTYAAKWDHLRALAHRGDS